MRQQHPHLRRRLCDDGNLTNGDGCDNCTVTACGNGIATGTEQCDDGNTTNGDGCDNNCKISACGNGIIAGTETCDDGNTTAGDGCSATCAPETGYTCTGTPSVCTTVCGDSIKAGAEQCDDGNTAAGDCCSPTCQVEAGCEIEPNTACGAQTPMPAFTGSPLASAVKGDINPATDADFYSFTLAGPGVQSIRVETYFGTPGTCTSTTANDTFLELRGTTCATVLASNEDGTGIGWCSLIDGTVTAAARALTPGTYSARVTRSTFGTQVPLVGYGMRVQILSTCGNGIVEPTETCDDGNTTAGDGCSNTCQVQTGFTCSGNPSVCIPIVCGNGVVQTGETCDDGNTIAGDGCSSTCAVEAGYSCTGNPSVCSIVCGDGVKAPSEACDDGNTVSGDCCSATCQLEPGCEAEPNNACGAQTPLPAFSGSPLETSIKGTVFPAADLDFYSFTLPGPGVQSVRIETYFGSPGTCGTTTNNNTTLELRGTTCTSTLTSNDDTINLCSVIDANISSSARALTPGTYSVRVARSSTGTQVPLYGYGLRVRVLSTCGNGIVEPTETCDDGNTVSGDGCSNLCQTQTGFTCAGNPSVCTAVVCGNGVISGSETCDDGNTTAGDGCSATCTVQSGFTCAGQPSVCTAVACGNGIVQSTETCDDGNTTDGDGCTSTCAVQAGFTCSGTPSVCTPIACGNGIRQTGEGCDDGNTASGDGCSATCAIEPGYLCYGATPSNCLTPEVNCNDGLDNNGKGGADAADPTCFVPGYFPACAGGQTRLVIPATGLPQAIPDNAPARGITSTVNVTAGGTIQRAALFFDITHTFDGDVDMFLTPPGGSPLDINTDNGSSGDHFTNTVLDSTCSTSIAGLPASLAPFQGCFQPETSFASLIGTSPNGAWALRVADDASGDVGTWNAWSMVFCT
ncbi:MAG: DUF4215 domain-containing protein, partial [Polyangiaceae bacterium]